MRYDPSMKHLIMLCFMAILVSALTCGCATAPSRPKKVVTIETREPILVKDVNGRVSVEVGTESTIVEIDERRFVCQDYRGYIGQLDSTRGWLKVGRLEFSYDEQMVTIRGKKTWTSFDRTGKQNYFAKQDGTVGRSVFKN